jgi:glycolate oxidase iron-sulfur subunit
MDAWQRPVHAAAIAVLGAAGVARRLAERVMASMPGEAPVLVDSAGCGAQLKEYGHVLGTPAAIEFSRRVFDIQEWLAQDADRLPPARRRLGPVIVQDPCHLRHVQRTHLAVRTVLAPYADLVELDDEGLCCGAGGAYSTLHPGMAADVRARKLAAIERAGGGVVASANPGCALHLAAAGVTVRHPMELVAEAIADGR